MKAPLLFVSVWPLRNYKKKKQLQIKVISDLHTQKTGKISQVKLNNQT